MKKVRWGQTAVKAVDGIIDGYPGDYTKEWVSDEMPVGVWIRLSFPQPVFIGKIVGYDRPNLKDHIRAFRLHFSDGSHVEYGEMNNDGTSSIFEFEPRQTNWIELEVTAAAGENVGLAEFRVWGYIALGKQPGTESKILPQTFCISSNFPNPFNAMTQFEVHIPEPGWLQMAIFNIKERPYRKSQTIWLHLACSDFSGMEKAILLAWLAVACIFSMPHFTGNLAFCKDTQIN
ncbi:MAG: hypothetical protein H6696_17535 [Deferribacteres bacterium]|nr:hypothetical protein [Deferribacteres bacterium]